MLSRSELAVRCHCLSGRSNDAESANETTTIETTIADNCGIIVLKSGSPREQVCQAPGQLKGAQSLVNLIIRSEASLANDAAHSTTGLSARNFKPKSDLRCACRCPLHVQLSCAWQCRMATPLRMAIDEVIAPRRSEDSS